MSLNIGEWKTFQVGRLFTMMNGKGITQEEISDNKGDFVAVQSGEENNGVMGYIDLNYCKEMKYTYSEKPCLTVARTGTAGFVSFQSKGCVVGDSAKILLLPDEIASTEVYLFLQSVLTENRFKYTYGRKVTEEKYLNDYLVLPAQKAESGFILDEECRYSDEGYVPDWQFMEDYIKSLHHKPLTTKNRYKQILNLNVENWKYVLLKDICKITMGNKMDASVMTSDKPEVNFVGRSADNNGVACKVDIVYDNKGERIEPYPAGCITVALGGSLGSTFLQKEPFYTSQNVSVLEFSNNVSDAAKLFICTLIYNESKYKYFPFGRELNTHIRTDYGFTIPVTSKNEPDWEFMENYIKSLPYGDRI